MQMLDITKANVSSKKGFITSFIFYQIKLAIVNRGSWLRIPLNIKAANKDAKMEVGRSTTVQLFCFSLIHNAWIT